MLGFRIGNASERCKKTGITCATNCTHDKAGVCASLRHLYSEFWRILGKFAQTMAKKITI